MIDVEDDAFPDRAHLGCGYLVATTVRTVNIPKDVDMFDVLQGEEADFGNEDFCDAIAEYDRAFLLVVFVKFQDAKARLGFL